ncbi:protein MIX23 [Tribolium castaneum]|uniref:Protein MIX23 n=1 Tax=Tribolium castaneum TaxID=7070 RepID=D6W9A5_TRICA|nr:PREDICTED: coiled-coil domain-containing protein 58 [Tribolium castaneum]EEZ98190.1 Coiled-coil domain-containing protein 58-like Protein [Tribolium castaneum]|eukprot:XP_968190.1 PREDICTED: coiled-coil domain-containing protein 58 [Tribolium castaneum]
MSLAITECGDFSAFQEAVKNMRKIDDLIISTLNTAIPTDSFHPDGESACKDLHKKLEEGNSQRTNVIKNCITVTANRVKELREKRDTNAEDISLSKALRSEQTKLRMLQVELTVEDLVQQRTAKVFHEKCRKYYKPL